MLPAEVTSLIGIIGDTAIMEVEKGAIKRYADAVGDSNPIYWDEEYAAKSRYGSIIAPPGFFGWPDKWSESGPTHTQLREVLKEAVSKAGYSRVLDGGVEYEFFSPIRAGDVLTASPRIVDIYLRESKGGTLIFTIIETSYIRKDSQLVAKAYSKLIFR